MTSVALTCEYTEIPAVFKFIFFIMHVKKCNVDACLISLYFVLKDNKSIRIIPEALNVFIELNCCRNLI